MMDIINLYNIDLKYIRNLSKVDDKVTSISPQISKDNRPFVGVVVLMNGKKYCIPLTSPKDKFKSQKSQIDFIKIYDEKQKDNNGVPKLIGVLNINNMIPVESSVITKIDLTIHKQENPSSKVYKELMQNQLRWCRTHYDIIQNRANKVYNIVTQTPEKSRNLVRRCCDFLKLETVLEKYLQSNDKQYDEPNQKISKGKFSLKQQIKQQSKEIAKRHNNSHQQKKHKKDHSIE